MVIGDYKIHPSHAAGDKAFEEVAPVNLRFRKGYRDAYHPSALVNPATGKWKTTRETSFYLSNKSIDAELAGKAIRDHWRIENSNHHLRDVTLDEDRSRIRTNPGIFARLRSFAANILRFNQKRSIRQDRYANALGGLSHIGRLAYR